jgi:hypothetical protein
VTGGFARYLADHGYSYVRIEPVAPVEDGCPAADDEER